MDTEKHTITGCGAESDRPVLRLSNTPHAMVHTDNAGDGDGQLSVNDPRWVFVVLVRRELELGPLSDRTRDRMVRCGERLGIAPMQARSLIATVERAVGGFGFGADTSDAIRRVSAGNHTPSAELSDRARWMVFGVLTCWAVMIAGLMQLFA